MDHLDQFVLEVRRFIRAIIIGRQSHCTDKHIAYLERELDSERDIVSGYRSRNYAQEQELKEANRKIYELNQKQRELERVISKIPPEVLQQLAQQEKEARKRKAKGWER